MFIPDPNFFHPVLRVKNILEKHFQIPDPVWDQRFVIRKKLILDPDPQHCRK
jgi:hypothetical protein